METPEQRRDAFLAALFAAGGTKLGERALAQPDTPHTIAAYEVLPGYPRRSVREAVDAAIADHQVDVTDLITWTPEPIEEVGDSESGDD